MSTAEFFDRYFEPLAMSLTPQTARAIVALKPDDTLLARVEELGRKSNDGSLTDDERDEYRTYIDAGDLIAILKAKARRQIAREAAG